MTIVEQVQQVSQSALCRAVQDGFLLSDLSDLPAVVVTSQINSPDPGKYLPELPNFMQYYTWCHPHVVRTCRPRTSSTHIVRACCLRTSSAHHLHVVCVSSVHAHMLSAPGHIIRTLQAICTTPHGHRGPELSFTVTGICY